MYAAEKKTKNKVDQLRLRAANLRRCFCMYAKSSIFHDAAKMYMYVYHKGICISSANSA